MRHIVVGTAGHIDHGKTTLVRALTGIDTDRLEEEKRRGISINLGFAHLTLTDELAAGFIDVPGHERFVRNMLAGVGGIDLVMLVISANEGIKPQTREHFDICRLLGITRGIVVFTKSDLVEPDKLENLHIVVDGMVAGTFLDGAPRVAVSATSGLGLDELKQELTKIGESIGHRDPEDWMRLPVDRAFSMKGFGTVVTGTLLSGRVRESDELETFPQLKKARVRAVQTYGHPVPEALAGQRTALNLLGVEPDEVPRGAVLIEPGRFQATDQALVRVNVLPQVKAVESGIRVHVYAGTAEAIGELRWLSTDTVEAGDSAYARLILREPLLLAHGDRFVLRQSSPVVTIGGGVVLDARPVRLRGAEAFNYARVLDQGSIGDKIRMLVEQARWGVPETELASVLAMRETSIMVEAGDLPRLTVPQGFYMTQGQIDRAIQGLIDAVQVYHQSNGIRPGMPREELRSKALPYSPAGLLTALLSLTDELISSGDVVRHRDFQMRLNEAEDAAVHQIEAVFAAAGLAVPSIQEALATTGMELSRARALLQLLLKSRRLVKVDADLVMHYTALDQLREMMWPMRGKTFGVGQFKEWTGVSRKYAIPLLEWLDREKVTKRVGNDRLVL